MSERECVPRIHPAYEGDFDVRFVDEVRKCVAIGMPLACCHFWPECAHVLAWLEKRDEASAG